MLLVSLNPIQSPAGCIVLSIRNNRQWCEQNNGKRVVEGRTQYAFEAFIDQEWFSDLLSMLGIELSPSAGAIDGRAWNKAIEAAVLEHFVSLSQDVLNALGNFELHGDEAARREEPVVWSIYNDQAVDA